MRAGLLFLAALLLTTPAGAQTLIETVLEKRAKPAGPRVNLHMYGNPRINATVVPLKLLDQVFKELAARKDIPFQLPDDGCYARAHKMAVLLERWGIISVKVFTEGHLKVATARHPHGAVYWEYHVAPAVLTREKNKFQVMVVDPSLFDRPVAPEEWAGFQTADQGKPPQISFWPRFTYHSLSRHEDAWLPNELVGAQDHLEKFLRLAHDPVALVKYREYMGNWRKGMPEWWQPQVFNTFFEP